MSIPNCNPLATSFSVFLSTSAASSPAAENSVFGNAGFATKTSDVDRGKAHTVTTAPFETSMPAYRSNSSLAPGSECLLQDAHCSLQGPGHSLDGLKDECVLWDTSCSGNRTLATMQFYDSVITTVTKNQCFQDLSPDCSKNNPLGRMSAFGQLKNWMRSSECESEDPNIIDLTDPDKSNWADAVKDDLFMNQTCCGYCVVAADKVDVYYWPDPHADTSCLSIIGNGTSDLAVGATTDNAGNIYWGCTSWDSSLGTSGLGSPLIVTTATLTTIASVTFRTYLYNPWWEMPCENSPTSLSSSLDPKVKPRDTHGSLRPRGHTLVAPNGSVSTAVLGDFTL